MLMLTNNHAYNIETDSRIMLAQSASHACAVSRTGYFPMVNADFSASGCLDAPDWVPAGSCAQWFHNSGHVGMAVVCRE